MKHITFGVLTCALFTFSLNLSQASTEEKHANKVMSARCIHHGFHRAVSESLEPEYFPPGTTQLVAHMAQQVEIETADYTRPIDVKLKRVFTWPYILQSLLFSWKALPFYDSYVLSRKAMIQKEMKSALIADCTQFVILGAGFDPSAVLLAQNNPSVTFFSIDLPGTQQIFLNALESYKGRFNGRELKVSHFPYDPHKRATVGENFLCLSRDLESGGTFEALEECGYDKHKKTFLLMEGVTAYLPESTVKSVLADYKANSAAQSLALIGFIQKKINTSQAQQEAHKQSNEPHKFTLPVGKTVSFMNGLGFHIEGIFNSHSAVALNVGSYLFQAYKTFWLSHELDDEGVDPSKTEPYFLISNKEKSNSFALSIMYTE